MYDSLLSLSPQPHPSRLGCHRAPGWTPYVIEQLPTNCFNTIVCIRQCHFLNSSHTLLPLL